MPVYYIVYLLLCLVVAFWGSDKKFGFWGYFFASVLLTPLMGAILVVASAPAEGQSQRQQQQIK